MIGAFLDFRPFPRFDSSCIKSPKPKPPKSRRLKLAGRIKELAKRDIEAATTLAYRGREFNEIEALIHLYYSTEHEINQTNQDTKTDVQKLLEIATDPTGERVWSNQEKEIYLFVLQRNLKKLSDDLCGIFINALNAHDSKKIFEIAKAIKLLKTFKSSGDLFRAKILTWKNILDKKGEQWPIRRLAKAIGWSDMSGADEFKTVRRMCEELNFPLAESRHKADKPD